MSAPIPLRQNQPDLLAVIDIGSSKTTVLCGHSRDDGTLTFAGYGRVNSTGVRKGIVADLKIASEEVKRAVEMAEKMAGYEIARAVVSVGGPHIRGINSRGGLTLGSRQREIDREDIRTALDRARSVQLPSDRTILHLLPREFVIDNQPGVQDPLGMTGSRLEVNLHIVTASASAVQSVVTAVNKAGIVVDDTIFEGVASAESLNNLEEGERVIGACVLDIGAG
ncbi:MAG: cell division protein FtsA, partial [Acidobacteriales bacterium]|nr:cell division protein FtsA [Terriglobales bacterium]